MDVRKHLIELPDNPLTRAAVGGFRNYFYFTHKLGMNTSFSSIFNDHRILIPQ